MSLRKNITVLMSGTVLAQLIPILLSPVITRIYSPEQFGLFAVYISTVFILGYIVSGKYEEAIPLPKSDLRSVLLTILSLCTSFLVSTMLLVVCVVLYVVDKDYFFKLGLPSSVWFPIWLGTVLLSFNQIFGYWFIRNEKYNHLSINKFYQSVINGFLSVIIGLKFKNFGLIAADIISKVVVNLIIFKIFIQDHVVFNFLKKGPFSFHAKLLIRTAKKYALYPKYLVPASLLNISAKQLPYILLGLYYSTSLAGLLLMAQRVILGPLGIISLSFSQALLKPMAEQIRENGNCWGLYKKSLVYLLLIPLPIIILGYFLLEWAVEVVLGSEWTNLTKIIYLFTPYFYSYIVSGTLNIVVIASGRQKINLFMQSVFFILIVGTIASSIVCGVDENQILINLSVAYTIYFSSCLVVTTLIAKGKLK